MSARLAIALMLCTSIGACAAPPPTAVAPAPVVTPPAPVVAVAVTPAQLPMVEPPRQAEPMPALPPPPIAVVDADPQPPPARYPLPTPLATTQTNMPIDAVRVAAAIIDRLSGGTGLAAGVMFSDEAGAKVDASRSALPGLDWRDSKLLQYAPVEYSPRVAPHGRVAAGQLEFADDLDRRATILFSVEYSLADEPIAVLNIEIAPIFALDPEVALFVVDAVDVPGTAGAVPPTHAGLLRLALEKGVRWRSVPPPDGARDWMIFAFLMERVSPSSRLRLGVTDQPQTAALFDATARVLDDGGWRVAVMPGRFSLYEAGLWARAEFAPGVEADPKDRRLRTIGLFPLSIATVRADAAR
jgi:hypothetical protein